MTADHEELRALMQRYARAADDRDVEALTALFHPDAEIVGARGALSREAWLETMRTPRAFPSSMHLIGDPLIAVEPDRHRANLDTYAVVYQLADPHSDAGDLTLGIRYLDTCVRDEGAWVISRRTAETRWMR